MQERIPEAEVVLTLLMNKWRFSLTHSPAAGLGVGKGDPALGVRGITRRVSTPVAQQPIQCTPQWGAKDKGRGWKREEAYLLISGSSEDKPGIRLFAPHLKPLTLIQPFTASVRKLAVVEEGK